VKPGSEPRESGLPPISGGESAVESDTINALEAYGEPPIAASLLSVGPGTFSSFDGDRRHLRRHLKSKRKKLFLRVQRHAPTILLRVVRVSCFAAQRVQM